MFPKQKKSRFWTENQQKVGPSLLEEEGGSLINQDSKSINPAKFFDSNICLSKSEVYTEEFSSRSYTSPTGSQAFLRTDRFDVNLINPQGQTDHESSLNGSQTDNRQKDFFVEDRISEKTEESGGSQTHRQGYKGYREKMAIRVIPPKQIETFGGHEQPGHSTDRETRVPNQELEGRRKSLSIFQYLGGKSAIVSLEDPETRKIRLSRTFRRCLNAGYFIGSVIALTNQIKIRGTVKAVSYLQKSQTKRFIEQKKSFLPLLPTDLTKIFWNLILVTLLFFSAILTPFTVSFIEDDNEVFNAITYVFDVLFGIDIVVNFISAYYNSSNDLVTDKKKIVLRYLQTWFILDLILILPIDSFIGAVTHVEGTTATRLKKLLRLTRFPRIYRIMKVLTLFKTVKFFIKNKTINLLMKQLSLNVGLIKMSQVLANLLFLNHIAACIWFLFARLDDFHPDTWVARIGLLDSDPITQYIAAYYWAFQTLTTVGYGDMNPETPIERFLAVLWMIVGVCLYSFAIANLSSILQSVDRRTSMLRNKVTAFNNFAAKVKLNELLRQKVQRFFELNHKENVYYWIDPHELVQDLPHNLRQSVLLYTYYPMIKGIKLLQIDANFTTSIATSLKLLRLKKNEILYREDDPSLEIYFISKGSVKFVLEDGEGIFSLVEGTYCGELEILDNTKRISFCQACEATLLLVCNRTTFMHYLNRYPIIEAQVKKTATMRKEKFDNRILQLNDALNSGKRMDESMATATVAAKKLMKSTEYFSKMVNAGKGRKRFSSFHDAAEENWSKRGSETSFSQRPSKGKWGIFDVVKNEALRERGSMGDVSDREPPGQRSTKRKITNSLLNFFSKDKKAEEIPVAKTSETTNEGKPLVQSHLRQRLQTIIQQRGAMENETNMSSNSKRESTHSNSSYSETSNRDKRATPPPAFPEHLLQFQDSEPDRKRISLYKTGSTSPISRFNPKSQVMRTIDRNYAKFSQLKGEIDDIHSNFEKTRDTVINNFDLIASRQKEIDEMAERLFEIRK